MNQNHYASLVATTLDWITAISCILLPILHARTDSSALSKAASLLLVSTAGLFYMRTESMWSAVVGLDLLSPMHPVLTVSAMTAMSIVIWLVAWTVVLPFLGGQIKKQPSTISKALWLGQATLVVYAVVFVVTPMPAYLAKSTAQAESRLTQASQTQLLATDESKGRISSALCSNIVTAFGLTERGTATTENWRNTVRNELSGLVQKWSVPKDGGSVIECSNAVRNLGSTDIEELKAVVNRWSQKYYRRDAVNNSGQTLATSPSAPTNHADVARDIVEQALHTYFSSALVPWGHIALVLTGSDLSAIWILFAECLVLYLWLWGVTDQRLSATHEDHDIEDLISMRRGKHD